MPKKSDSKKKPKTKKPEVKKLSEEEFKKRVLDLADKGLTSEKIGETLRKEGIHPKEYGIKISTVLKEKNKYIIPEMNNIENKLKNIVKHREKNKQDKRALRERERVFAQLRKLKKYHKIA